LIVLAQFFDEGKAVIGLDNVLRILRKLRRALQVLDLIGAIILRYFQNEGHIKLDIGQLPEHLVVHRHLKEIRILESVAALEIHEDQEPLPLRTALETPVHIPIRVLEYIMLRAWRITFPDHLPDEAEIVERAGRFEAVAVDVQLGHDRDVVPFITEFRERRNRRVRPDIVSICMNETLEVRRPRACLDPLCEDLLSDISGDKSTQNHIHFLLVLGDVFKREKEDDHFKHRWFISEQLAEKVHKALKKLYEGLNNDHLISELDIVAQFLTHVEDVADHYKKEDIIRRWLSISKTIGKNPLGEWGLVASPNIHAKGIRDYAFLVLRKHGSPIHFREVAKSIEKLFGKKAHVATTHNELIKDSRFVLVGRGLYALAEWGYMSGVVKDVIRKVLDKNGPLTKLEIIDKVMKERYVKENTIVVNLQNLKYFKKDKEGRYSAVPVATA